MSHEERRTARAARPLSLLLLASLSLLVSSCGGGHRNAEHAGSGANANTSSANAKTGVAQPAPEAAAQGTAGKYTEGGYAARAREATAGGESYEKIYENPFLDASRAPLSTFS